jgi:hypothetical protein
MLLAGRRLNRFFQRLVAAASTLITPWSRMIKSVVSVSISELLVIRERHIAEKRRCRRLPRAHSKLADVRTHRAKRLGVRVAESAEPPLS